MPTKELVIEAKSARELEEILKKETKDGWEIGAVIKIPIKTAQPAVLQKFSLTLFK
jgi:hypothetical protein